VEGTLYIVLVKNNSVKKVKILSIKIVVKVQQPIMISCCWNKLWTYSVVFFKENVRDSVWICRDPIFSKFRTR